jgi:hypothetical protein
VVPVTPTNAIPAAVPGFASEKDVPMIVATVLPAGDVASSETGSNVPLAAGVSTGAALTPMVAAVALAVVVLNADPLPFVEVSEVAPALPNVWSQPR